MDSIRAGSSNNEDNDNDNNGKNNNGRTLVIVLRHGERLDYVSMEKDNINWVAANIDKKPYDPPLTEHGKVQAQLFGQHLANDIITNDNTSNLVAIYTSPFLRCRQTAQYVLDGYNHTTTNNKQIDNNNNNNNIKVQIEIGLSESINESWYRSWSLPGSDGTWGYKIKGKKEYDPTTIHQLAKQPIQTLLYDWKSNIDKNDDTVNNLLDMEYESKTHIKQEYCFDPPLLESRQQQRIRMKDTIEKLYIPNKIIIIISHGGPVTHLYEQLMNQPWYIHGESTYCCYSIYERKINNNNQDKEDKTSWIPIVINQSNYLHEKILHKDKYVTDTSD